MRDIVIVANGQFPSHPIPLKCLEQSDAIICCDGGAHNVVQAGFTPSAIVGDLDSLSNEMANNYRSILIHDPSQEYNDLTKAFNYSLTLNPKKVTIIGATGLREDHTLGNISLLLEYAQQSEVKIEMLTDYGVFEVVKESGIFHSEKGMQISFFSLDREQKILSKGLKYPLDNTLFYNLWRATLNETTGDSFQLLLHKSTPLLLFRVYIQSDNL